jgi:CRISPR-associated protein Cas1
LSAILTISTQGSKITKESKRIFVKKENETLLEIPVREIETVITFGNVHFSAPAVNTLSKFGVPITLLSYDGKARANVLPYHRKNLDLKYLQYKIAENETLRLEFAKAFVYGKYIGARNFLTKGKKITGAELLKNESGKTARYAKKIRNAETLEKLLGAEAGISVLHFAALRKLIKKEDFKFEKRTTRPPRDEMNSLMSFGYTLTETLLTSLLETNGFDVYMGLLHKPDYGRSSLSLDLLELFRFQIVDKFVLNLVNLGIINKNDFRKENGIYLNDEGRRKFMKNWTKLLHDEKNGLIKLSVKTVEELTKAVRNNRAPQFEKILRDK